MRKIAFITLLLLVSTADAWVSPQGHTFTCTVIGGSFQDFVRFCWGWTNGAIGQPRFEGDGGGGTPGSSDSSIFLSSVRAELWTDVDGDKKADADDTGSTWVSQGSVNITGTGSYVLQTAQSISDDTIRLSTQSTYDIRVGVDPTFTEINITGLAGFYLVRFVLVAVDGGFTNFYPYATSGVNAYMDGNGFAVDSDGNVTSRRVCEDAVIINFRVNRKPS